MGFPFLSSVFSVYDLLLKQVFGTSALFVFLLFCFALSALFVFACLFFLSVLFFFSQKKSFNFCFYSCVYLNILLFCSCSSISVFSLFLFFAYIECMSFFDESLWFGFPFFVFFLKKCFPFTYSLSYKKSAFLVNFCRTPFFSVFFCSQNTRVCLFPFCCWTSLYIYFPCLVFSVSWKMVSRFFFFFLTLLFGFLSHSSFFFWEILFLMFFFFQQVGEGDIFVFFSICLFYSFFLFSGLKIICVRKNRFLFWNSSWDSLLILSLFTFFLSHKIKHPEKFIVRCFSVCFLFHLFFFQHF